MEINLELIQEPEVREVFQRLMETLNQNPVLSGVFRTVVVKVDKAVTDLKIRHGLRFKPTDIIETSIEGSGTISWNRSQFTETYLSVSTTGPVTVRALVGELGS